MGVLNAIFRMQVGNTPQMTVAQPESQQKELTAVNNLPLDSFSNACHQYLEDHEHKPQGAGMFVYGMSKILGQTFTRRLSNFTSYIGLGQFYPAERDYPILTPCDDMAKRFQPNLFTIDLKQSQAAGLKPNQLRYEILPPQEDRNYYSIVYFVGLPTEKLPIPVLGELYDLARPVLFGSKQDWEGIQIDINKDTLDPVGISFETSNYTNSADTYNLISRKDMHLFTKISKMSDGTWTHTIQQKNGKIQTTDVPNPFRDGLHVNMAIVLWNTSLDLCDRVAGNSELKLYPLKTPAVQFMDMDTYRKEGIDLRATWLSQRRLGKFTLRLPPRSDPAQPRSAALA